jgi:hypothetical protein
MPARRLAAGFVAVSALGVSVACSRDPEVVERDVYVYAPTACPVSESDAYSVIYAGGDFEASISRPPVVSVFLREGGRTLDDLPTGTRSLVIDVTQSDSEFRGMTEIPSDGPVNILAWPQGATCRLTRDLERRTDGSLGVFGHHFMVTGGRSLDDTTVPNTYVGDLTTGAIERLAFGPSIRRSHATITPFQSGVADPTGLSPALVAGGEDPDSTSDILQTAEVYLPSPGAPSDVGDFDRQRIDLAEPRTEHGAVVLGNGETLLVGGRGLRGPLRTMEAVDPAKRSSRTGGIALMSVPRVNPTVIRLASGEILVAGGVDAQGNEVPTLEWFAPDASRSTKRPVDLVTGRERGFVPLAAGGALAVIIPENPPAPDFKTVWVISADGTLEPALPLPPSELDVVRLFPGADGAPALWTGKRWYRWAPWFGTFQPIYDGPPTGPTETSTGSGDPGLALWLEERGGELAATGYRFDVRTRFDAIPKPLIVESPSLLAPDRLAGFPTSSLRFDPTGGLYLGSGASAFVTDATFADFDLSVDVAPSSDGTAAGAASIVLREPDGTELEVGGGTCPFAKTPDHTISVRRRDRHVDVAIDGGPAQTCPPPLLDESVRVSLGVRGAQGVSLSGARNLLIDRR